MIVPKSHSNGEPEPVPKLLYNFKSGLESNLNSLSMSTDQENFISADEKTINLWSLDLANRATVFNLVNLNLSKDKHPNLISNANFNQFT